MKRAECHAPQVEEVLPLLAGIVLAHVDMSAGLQVKTYKGNYANVAWVRKGGNRYAFSYDHTGQKIQLKENTVRGKLLDSFNNADTYSVLKQKIKTCIV